MRTANLLSFRGLGAAVLLAALPGALCAAQAGPARAGSVSSTAPYVDRVEPPDWWAGHSINPVRVLLHGRNLTGARVSATGGGVAARNVRVSGSGDYVFVDVVISPRAAPGVRTLRVTTPRGTASAPFRVATALPAAGRFRGFSPDDVIYLIMPDRFDDGDTGNDDPAAARGLYGRDNPHLYHGGDLRGVMDRLPYLKDLGVTALWINPVYENTHSNTAKPGDPASSDYHGYGAINQYGVDPHLGDLADLRALVDRAHALGLKVIQDQVANHVGPHHPWAADPPTPTWFNGTPQHHLVNTFQVWTVIDPHAAPAESAATLDGWFVDTLPDLNQKDLEVARYEIQNTLWWLGETGLDGIREDTVPYVPRAFWQQWNTAIRRQYPRVNAVGEVFEGDAAKVAYFQGGRVGPDGVDTGMTSLFDYPLYFPLRRTFAQGDTFQGIAEDEAHDWLFPDPSRLVTFLGDHDVRRFMSEADATAAGLKLADTFLLTSRGIPCLYYGDEIGMTGGDDPDNRRDFPGGFPGDSRDAFTAAGRTPQEQEIWAHVRALTHLRARLAPLRSGTQKTLYLADRQWAYARTLGRESVLVVLNNDAKAATFGVSVAGLGLTDGATLTDCLGAAAPARVTGGVLSVTLPARTGAVFVK